jgi:AhpD family alkylhydroperoxidase
MTARIDYAAVAPDVYKALIGTHTALKKSGFDVKLMTLVFQRVSQINGCAYCVDLHGRDLRATGEPPERLDGLAAWDESPYFTEREKAALAWAESVTHIATSRAPDHVYDEMRRHFSERDATHLTMAIALMNALNRIAVSMRRGPTVKPAPS